MLSMNAVEHGWQTMACGLRMTFTLLLFFLKKFIYLFMAVLGLCCCARASHCGGFSCCGAQALGTLGFSSCSTQAQ